MLDDIFVCFEANQVKFHGAAHQPKGRGEHLTHGQEAEWVGGDGVTDGGQLRLGHHRGLAVLEAVGELRPGHLAAVAGHLIHAKMRRGNEQRKNGGWGVRT